MARYKEAVEWIAENDEPTIIVRAEIEGFVTTQLIADIFHKSCLEVATEIQYIRIKEK